MQKVFDYIERYHMIEAQDKVIVGVSGGADSLCLLFVLRSYCQKVPFTILAVHVEHGIRGEESREDARFVENLCRSWGIAFRCVSCQVPELARAQKLSLEEAARLARYEAFAQVCKETGANKIAVAHNRDDQAETILFQMARGSGLAGAGGMRPVRAKIIRPLLACGRAQIEACLVENGIAWRTDSTNTQTEYARNCLRHHILPLLKEEINASADVHLAALGAELQEVQDYMRRQAQRVLEKIAWQEEKLAWIEAAGLLQEPPVLQKYCLREWLERSGVSLKDVRRVHLEGLQALLWAQSGRQIVLPGGWMAARQFDKIILQRREKRRRENSFCCEATMPGVTQTPAGCFLFRVFPYKKQNILQKAYTKWLDYDKINKILSIRTRRPGDYMVVNRQGGTKKLKRYLIEQKVPAQERDSVPLLACENEILWVVGYRISEAYKVTEETRQILEVQMTGETHGRENFGNDFGGRGKSQDCADRGENQ